MSFAVICKFLDRFIPSTASRLYLNQVPIQISTSKHPLFSQIKSIPVGVYFQVDGEAWMIHALQSYKDVVAPFLIPLQYQYCADYHLILCSVKQYEKYPERLTEIWKKYGYGVIVIDQHSDPPIKLLDYPLTQYMFPEVRRQIHDFLKKTKNIQFFREPFWLQENDVKNFNFAPAPELLEIVKIVSQHSVLKENTYELQEKASYNEIIRRLKKNENVSLPERYSLASYLFKDIEHTLKTSDEEKRDMAIIINESYDKGLFSVQMKDQLHDLRMKRNKLMHSPPTENLFPPEVLLSLLKVKEELTHKKEAKPLTKKFLKTLPKKESTKLPYGNMKKELEKNTLPFKETSYNPLLDSLMKKYGIRNAVNPKILTIMLLDNFDKEINSSKLMLEVEDCCKENNPDLSNYPLLTYLVNKK